ncbi:MAG: PEFG-CTERM sorting domain-containing protein [Thaumarchaeota archaeon]|nr:PEFG-CTERM sorting domain-containing protein [Nitrososphaerota archaeon]
MKILIAIILSLSMFAGIGPVFAQVESPGFTNATSISSVSGDSELPSLLVSNDGVFVIWTETDSGKSNVLFSKSTDGGYTFDNPVNLSATTNGQSSYPQFAENGTHIYVVWQSALSGTSNILMTRSLDGGTSFEKPLQLSDGSQLSAFPQVALSGNNVYSSWIEKSADNSTNIIFTKSNDQGNSFGAPLHVTHNMGNSGIPKLSAYASNVYLLWEDNSKGDYEVFLSKSSDSGASFHVPIDISTTAGQSGTPEVVVSGNNVYAVWMDNTSGNYDIFFTKSADGGVTFEKPIDISNLKGDSGYPQITVWKNNVYVTWTQTMTGINYDVFFAKSTNNGDTFDQPINLSNNLGPSGWPKIASDGNVYVSWADSSYGKFDILITKSTDGGTTFESPVNLSHSKSESYESEMALLNSTVYMVWQEEQGQSGNHTVVFSKSTTFVPEFGPFASIALVVSIVSIIAISFRSNLRMNIN